MAAPFQRNGHKIDRESELILLDLEKKRQHDPEDPFVDTGRLAGVADLKNQSVLYRMDKYLVPGGWVEEADDDRDARRFQITQKGLVFVDDHREEIDPPQTAEEACEVARQAREDVADLHERVQQTQGAVTSFEQRFEGLQNDVAEQTDRALEAADDAWNRVEDLRRTVSQHGTTLKETRGELQELEARVDEKADRADLRHLRETVISDRATNQEVTMAIDQQVTPLKQRVDELEDTADIHRDHIDQLGDEAARWRQLRTAGILGRLRWLLTGTLPSE